MQAAKLLKQKRQQKGYSQKKMAELIGCTPSALCMFEKGKTEALSVERLGKACEVLGLKPGELLNQPTLHYCTNPFCPTHQPYSIGDEIALKPTPLDCGSGDGFCSWCGDVLVCECESCHAAFVGSGAFCPTCGQAYVALPDNYEPNSNTTEKLRMLREERTVFADIMENGI